VEGFRKEARPDGNISLIPLTAFQQPFAPTLPPSVEGQAAISNVAVENSRKGKQYKETADFPQALDAFSRARELGDVSVLADMGDCLVNMGRIEEAICRYEEALRFDRMNPQALVGIGVANLLQVDFAAACDSFTMALASDPENARALSGLGMARNGQGFKNAGYNYFKKALDADPENQTALHELIKLSYEFDTFEEAERRLSTYLMYHPGDLDMLFSLTGIFYKSARYDEARDSLESLLALSPDYAGGAELLALILAGSSKPIACDTENPVISGYQQSPEIFVELGRIKKEEGKFGEALEAFDKARVLGDTAILTDMGDCKANLGKLDEATTLYLERLQDTPEDSRALVGLGVVNMVLGNQTKAVTWFNKALKYNPANDRALCGLGMVRNLQNKPKEALKYFTLALDTDPENLPALHEIVKCSYELNKFDEAEKYLQNYLMYHPGDLYMLFSLAGVYFNKGDYKSTLENIDNILVFNPDFAGGTELREKAYTRLATSN
jgi:O-antigen biosynthesis protein